MALKNIPDRYLGMIIHFLMNFHNDTSEFSRPHLRQSFQHTYKLFILLYGALIVTGFALNVMLLIELFQRQPYNISMYKYLAFNAINDIIKCTVILPLALSTTLIQNWVYGNFFCYFFPMIQDIPFHATMLTFFFIAFDRYRQTLYPLKQPLPVALGIMCVTIVTLFAVLPYGVYTRYLDLEIYFGTQFKGTGICAINVEDNIEEYIRGLFIIMYVLPLGLIAFLHIKTSEEIKSRQTSYTVTFHDSNTSRENDSSLPPTTSPTHMQSTTSNTLTVPKQVAVACEEAQDRALQFTTEANDDWKSEKQMQAFLAAAVTTYASCLLPLNLMRLLKHVVYETYENSFFFDISFILVVWLAFFPTITTPAIFLTWQKSGMHNSSLSRYLRLGRSSDVSFSAYDIQRNETAAEKTN